MSVNAICEKKFSRKFKGLLVREILPAESLRCVSEQDTLSAA